jgi:DNA-binding Lrp family transcriptional regulator
MTSFPEAAAALPFGMIGRGSRLRFLPLVHSQWHLLPISAQLLALAATSGKILATPPMNKLDNIDRRILRVLQRDGRMQNVELAEKVGLSPSPCLRRVKMLEEAGVIERYVAVLDASKIGVGLTFFARVWLHGQDSETVNHFTEEVKRLPQVVECHLMAGDCDFLLRIVAADIDAYRKFQVDHLTRIKSVQSVKTDIPMQKIKLTSELPI